MHNTGQQLRGLSLHSKNVVRQIYCARHDSIGLTGLSDLNTNKNTKTPDCHRHLITFVIYFLQDGMPLGNGVVPPPPFPENLAELMNSGTAPNVTLQVSRFK